MRPVATSDVLVVVATKLAVPRGAEVTVKVSPMSIAPPTVMLVSCFTGITEVTESVLTIETPAAVPLKPTILAVVSVNHAEVVNIASVPLHETTRVPWLDEPTLVNARILPAMLEASRGLFPAPVFLSIVATSSLQFNSSAVDPAIFLKVITQVPILSVELFAGNDWTSTVLVALTSDTLAVILACVSVSEFDPTDTFATDSTAVKVAAKAAKAAGVSVENTNPKIRATEVTFLNVSENEIFIR